MRPLCAAMALTLLITVPALAAEKDMPYREDSGLSKAEYLLSVGKFTAALNTAKDVLKRHPNNADAYTYLGYAYYRLGEVEPAAKNFYLALKLNPTHLGANKYLADMYLDAGDVARALEQLQVIRMTCGHSNCAELDALELEIDRYKNGDHAKPAPTADGDAEEPQPAPK